MASATAKLVTRETTELGRFNKGNSIRNVNHVEAQSNGVLSASVICDKGRLRLPRLRKAIEWLKSNKGAAKESKGTELGGAMTRQDTDP